MTKEELVKAVAERSKLRKKDADAFLKALTKVIAEALKGGDRVEIRGFGTFLMKERAPRVARNPKTGKEVKIPAKLVPVFKPGKDLKEATERVING